MKFLKMSRSTAKLQRFLFLTDDPENCGDQLMKDYFRAIKFVWVADKIPEAFKIRVLNSKAVCLPTGACGYERKSVESRFRSCMLAS